MSKLIRTIGRMLSAANLREQLPPRVQMEMEIAMSKFGNNL